MNKKSRIKDIINKTIFVEEDEDEEDEASVDVKVKPATPTAPVNPTKVVKPAEVKVEKKVQVKTFKEETSKPATSVNQPNVESGRTSRRLRIKIIISSCHNSSC